ncbi:MAG: hypothetical protein ACFFBH_00620 [Promethearchaeota archaeon]
MICRHGLEIINCPVCRISINTRPLNDLKPDLITKNLIKPMSPVFKQHFKNNNDKLNFGISKTKFTHTVPLPKMMGQIPNFENRLFLEKLKEINVKKFNKYGVSKNIPFSKKEFNLENIE